MKHRMWAATLCLVGAVQASEPGQPPDCSDWVFTEQGYTCTDYNPFPGFTGFRMGGTIPAIDNEEHLYRMQFAQSTVGTCSPYPLYRHVLERIDGPSATPFAWIEDKCVDAVSGDAYLISFPGPDNLNPGRLVFLPHSGRMLAPLSVNCSGPFEECPPNPSGDQMVWVVAIDGFVTTLPPGLARSRSRP